MHHEPGMKLFNDKARHILGKKKKHSIFTELRGKLKKESSLYQRLNRGLKWIQKKLSLLVLRVRESDAVIPALPAEKDGVSAEQKQEDEKKTAQKPVFEDEANWDAIYRDYLMLYESNLDKIGRLLKMHGIDGVFIFQPDLSYKQQVSALHFEDEKQE